MRTTAPTEVGELAAGAIREILGRGTAGRAVGEYVEDEPIPWRVFEEGGWDRIGVPEAAGGGDASLRDLVEVAMVWGASCVPLPLLESTVVRRWSAAARDESGPLTVSVPAAGVSPGAGLAPFAAL